VHRPVGWRDKRACDRDYVVHCGKVARDLMRSAAWREARAAFLVTHPTCTEVIP
jgi:hypothetical protein